MKHVQEVSSLFDLWPSADWYKTLHLFSEGQAGILPVTLFCQSSRSQRKWRPQDTCWGAPEAWGSASAVWPSLTGVRGKALQTPGTNTRHTLIRLLSYRPLRSSAFVVYNQTLHFNNTSSYVRCEAFEFVDPVGQSGERGHHQEGAHYFLFYHHGDVSDALDGLSQSHLISQDSIDAVLPQHLKTPGWGLTNQLRPWVKFSVPGTEMTFTLSMLLWQQQLHSMHRFHFVPALLTLSHSIPSIWYHLMTPPVKSCGCWAGTGSLFTFLWGCRRCLALSRTVSDRRFLMSWLESLIFSISSASSFFWVGPSS